MNDRIEHHHRQQLSALMDGALAPDEARFLLRRLHHDRELGGCWERWQLAGDVLRGQATAVLPTGFADRVAQALTDDAGPSAANANAPRPRWTRWSGGAALAASVAVAVLFMARPAPEGPASEPVVAAGASMAPDIATTAPPRAPVTPPAPALAERAAVVAVTDAPRPAARRVPRGQRPRAIAAATPAPQVEAVATAAPAELPGAATALLGDPFATQSPVPSRPWPRAVLPQYSAGGALTAGVESTSSSSFYPFEPRLPPPEEDAHTPNPSAAPPPH